MGGGVCVIHVLLYQSVTVGHQAVLGEGYVVVHHFAAAKTVFFCYHEMNAVLGHNVAL